MKTVRTDYKNLRAALDTARGFGPDCSVVLNSAEIRALLSERDALRDALETMVEMVEMNGFGRAYAMGVARDALAQGEV